MLCEKMFRFMLYELDPLGIGLPQICVVYVLLVAGTTTVLSGGSHDGYPRLSEPPKVRLGRSPTIRGMLCTFRSHGVGVF